MKRIFFSMDFNLSIQVWSFCSQKGLGGSQSRLKAAVISVMVNFDVQVFFVCTPIFVCIPKCVRSLQLNPVNKRLRMCWKSSWWFVIYENSLLPSATMSDLVSKFSNMDCGKEIFTTFAIFCCIKGASDVLLWHNQNVLISAKRALYHLANPPSNVHGELETLLLWQLPPVSAAGPVTNCSLFKPTVSTPAGTAPFPSCYLTASWWCSGNFELIRKGRSFK